MKPIEFEGYTDLIAKNQPQYRSLPAHIDVARGVVTCCWKLSLRERFTLLLTGEIWQHVRTFGAPLQPQLLGSRRPSFYGSELARPTS
jgi:hypothetical protein